MTAKNLHLGKALKTKLKKVLFPKKQNIKYYNSLDVPAKLFFDILDEFNLEKLVIEGNPSKEDLESAWSNIFDEYFKEVDEYNLKIYLKINKNISLLNYKITAYQKHIFLLLNTRFSKEQEDLYYKELSKIKLRIKKGESKLQFCDRVLKTIIPSLQTQIELEKHNLEEITKGKKQSFQSKLRSIEKITELNYRIDSNITLAEYISYEKQING